jgi:hypothetical protein
VRDHFIAAVAIEHDPHPCLSGARHQTGNFRQAGRKQRRGHVDGLDQVANTRRGRRRRNRGRRRRRRLDRQGKLRIAVVERQEDAVVAWPERMQALATARFAARAVDLNPQRQTPSIELQNGIQRSL